MQSYPEVPEWWFLCVTLISMTFGFICLGVYTNVSPAVVMVAPIITIIFIIPVGIVTAVSGMEPSLNIISELIGGAFAGGDTMTVQVCILGASDGQADINSTSACLEASPFTTHLSTRTT